jgi:hypothetical protein
MSVTLDFVETWQQQNRPGDRQNSVCRCLENGFPDFPLQIALFHNGSAFP